MNYLKKIFSPSFFILSIFLFIYTFYKSEIYWDGNKNDYYFTYYLISLIFIFLSIFTFFIHHKIKEYVIIIVISTVITLYLLEAYLIFKKQISKEQLSTKNQTKEQLIKDQIYENNTGKKFDKRTKLEILNDLKNKDKKIQVPVTPYKYINKNKSLFPLSGVSNSKTIFCNENGYYATYQSDRYGFNNPDDNWDSDEIEYLLVGDSFTHGACVNRPNDMGSVLRNLSKQSVLNLGYSGNGPLIEFATLREYMNSNVKKVLWIYFEDNDLSGLHNEMSDKILMKYYKDVTFTQNLKFRQKEIDNLSVNFINKEKSKKNIKRDKGILKVELVNFIKITNLRVLIYPPPQLTSNLKEILKLTKKLVNDNNSKLYFIYLPGYARYSTNYDNKSYNLVKNIVNQLDIPFVDIPKEVFEKEKNPLNLFPFKMNGHYTVEGYKKVSVTIYNFTRH
ncbi:hypothetical protein [Candidatus Pelagibacter ubique]|uniref:hypothetical protein n=1 Tax=Pelagibacter ubique TaxID=198252 RepID=UPI0003D1B2A1